MPVKVGKKKEEDGIIKQSSNCCTQGRRDGENKLIRQNITIFFCCQVSKSSINVVSHEFQINVANTNSFLGVLEQQNRVTFHSTTECLLSGEVARLYFWPEVIYIHVS